MMRMIRFGVVSPTLITTAHVGSGHALLSMGHSGLFYCGFKIHLSLFVVNLMVIKFSISALVSKF